MLKTGQDEGRQVMDGNKQVILNGGMWRSYHVEYTTMTCRCVERPKGGSPQVKVRC